MKIAAWKSRISAFLAIGAVALAGALSDAPPAAAQAGGACPVPAGVTPPPPPRVTAQQVENGSASLMEFALAVRDRFREGTASPAESFYVACLIRQEESPWRSGGTYLVTLTPNGRIWDHAKTMAFSGRLLKPEIYGAILHALGIDPAALADPAAARAAFAAAAAGNGGAFDVPHLPGAAGYAVMSELVQLAGFDIDESHLAEEEIDFGDPSVTAAEVVDRKTLKAFVTQAGERVVRILESGSYDELARTKTAFRDPNGPWRHGSVYLYALDITSNIILFHGAFPNRHENRPLVAQARDPVTGRLILPQILEAAASNPEEGGFLAYHFDDPVDPNDSADVPKIGYARQFTARVGPAATVEFVVGSGFYLNAPGVAAASRNAVVESVLPQVMRAATASAVDAISGRVRQAASGSPPAGSASLGGASTLSDALLARRTALENGTFALDRLLADSSFVLPLGAAGGGGGGPLGNLTLWGGGDWRSFSGGDSRSVSYDGEVTSGSLGIDAGLGANLLAGLSVARTQGKVDYTDFNALKGKLTTTLTSLNPYMGWRAPGGMSLWAAAGHGAGEVEIEDGNGTETRDLTQRMAAAGASGPLVSSGELIGGGATNLNLKGEAAFTWADIDGSGTVAGMSLSASRQRLMLEGEHVRKLDSGATFTPSLEIGLRNDGGDGETGAGIEAGGGLRYADAASGLSVEGRARTLLGHGGDYKEKGVSGMVRLAPGATGQGLSLAVEPAWGRPASGVRRLWESGVATGASPDNRARLNAEIGYGLGAAPGLGVVTPYAGLGLAGEGARAWRAGARWRIAPEANLNLEGTRSEGAAGIAPEHGLMLRGALRW